MAAPLSMDLRRRVLDAIEQEGMSRRAAAARFGIGVRTAIRSAGAKLFFLPPYSPGLNPIEQVFAKLKALLRKANARTIEAVNEAMAKLLDEYTPQECANYLVNSGYGST